MEQDPTNRTTVDKVAELLERSGINPEDIQRVNRVNTWQGFYKDSDGEAQTVDLVGVQFTPVGDEQIFVQQAKPTIIRPTKTKPRKPTKERQALIVTDAQVWMGRSHEDFYPFHDRSALSVVQQIARQEQPDQIVIVGDFADFPSMSRFRQEPSFENTLTESLNEMHLILAQLRANVPDAKIVMLEGNHELRLRRYIYDQARALYNLKVNGESILDLKNLLRLGELDIEYIDGYPNGRYWLNDRLKVVHGETVKQLGKTVTNLIRNDDTSSITGHIHRFEMAQRTIPGRHAGRVITAASFGTLSRIDGAVPSYHSSTDSSARPTLHIEQWQQGAGWVSYEEGDRPFDIQPITIHTFDDYKTRFNGKVYLPE